MIALLSSYLHEFTDFWGRKLQVLGHPQHQERARQGICYTRRQAVYVGLLFPAKQGNGRATC